MVLIFMSVKNVVTCLETAIDQHAEWRHYGGDGKPDPARCSMPVNNLLPQSSMSSIMLTKGTTNYSMRRTQKIHSWGAMTYKRDVIFSKIFLFVH